MSLILIFIAIVVAASSGVPAQFLSRTSTKSGLFALLFMSISVIAAFGAVVFAFCKPQEIASIEWPAMDTLYFSIDPLSAFFLVPVFLMGFLGSLYGVSYWPHDRHPSNSRKLLIFWGLLVAGMAILIVSKHAMAFLIGWEIMALSAFFLVSTEDNRGESRFAAWVYLIATHVGTLSLFAVFSLWKHSTGSYMLTPVESGTISFTMMNILFFFALLGFGLKTGAMPFHFWLPSAHATAPTHVSAMLSGVVLKMGIYGLIRWLSLFPSPPYAWGTTIIFIGFISGLFGVVFAIAQHDIKRLLAYHSVENIGIILIGIGIALIGRAANMMEITILGLAGALLHVWNHSFFKSLLFYCAGAVVHTTHTRKIDLLGGLAKKMPQTALWFLIGAIAICGLPPLNGFVSELFIYFGLFKMVMNDVSDLTAALGVPVLAMIGALAAACFVKVFGTVFLGSPRSSLTNHAHEPPVSMRSSMVVLVIICAVIGIFPFLIGPVLERVIVVCYSDLSGIVSQLSSTVPLKSISILAGALAFLLIIIGIVFVSKKKNEKTTVTWDCGYVKPSNSMQYTATSFAATIISFFKWILKPHEHRPDVTGLFPKATRMLIHTNEIVLDRVLIPVSRHASRFAAWFHRFQQGIIQHYIFYIVITLFVLLCSQMPLKQLILNWFTK
ncbi:MAG: hydrogenase [Fibrobacter sp.]|nr:hydrogenase [Fibrobacter sp.]